MNETAFFTALQRMLPSTRVEYPLAHLPPRHVAIEELKQFYMAYFDEYDVSELDEDTANSILKEKLTDDEWNLLGWLSFILSQEQS